MCYGQHVAVLTKGNKRITFLWSLSHHIHYDICVIILDRLLVVRYLSENSYLYSIISTPWYSENDTKASQCTAAVHHNEIIVGHTQMKQLLVALHLIKQTNLLGYCGTGSVNVTLLLDEWNWGQRTLSLSLCPGGFFQSSIIQQNLITRFVPFLPLSRRHVERCVRSQLCQQGSCSRSDVVEAVGDDMIYTPVQGQYFSTTGCKAVPAKINFFLWAEWGLFGWFKGTEREKAFWGESVERNQFCHMEIRGQSSVSGAGRDSESRLNPTLESQGIELITFWIQSIFVPSSPQVFLKTLLLWQSVHVPSVSTTEVIPQVFDHKSRQALPQMQLCF